VARLHAVAQAEQLTLPQVRASSPSCAPGTASAGPPSCAPGPASVPPGQLAAAGQPSGLIHAPGLPGVALPRLRAQGLAVRMAASADRNLRRALLSLEAARVERYPFADDQPLALPDWELYIKVTPAPRLPARPAYPPPLRQPAGARGEPPASPKRSPHRAALGAHFSAPLCSQEIAGDCLSEQSPRRLYQVRGKLYELLASCVPPEVVLRCLASELMRKLDDELRRSTAVAAAGYEHRLQEGSKAIFHIEAFVARFMSDYKAYLMSMVG
jgi:replication factor C subunit 3/5